MVEHASHARRQPWWQDLRWITAGVVVVLLGLLAWGLFGPEPPITVSRETTYLTSPLAADGLPDYGAAVLASLGPAPEPQDNAAVELLEVMWPLDIDAADLPLVCKALGIPDVPPADPLREPFRDAATKVTSAMYDAAGERPWTEAEFPELAAWLVAREAALDRLVAAADRPRYWLPIPELLQPGPTLLFEVVPLRDVQQHRAVARLLTCRAMGHAGAGRHAAAWHDIRAVYRLGRLLAVPENTPQFVVTQLVVVAAQATADAALTRGLLGSPDLPAEVMAAIRWDLDALGPPPEPAAGLAMERFSTIDAVVWLARRRPGGRAARLDRAAQLDWLLELSWGPDDRDSLLGTAVLTSLDWDLILERMNAAYDRLEAAARLPTPVKRRAEVGRLAEAVGRIRHTGWAAAGHAVAGCCSRRYRSEFVGDALCALLGPGPGSWLDAVTRGQASFDLTRTAVALAAWKAQRAAGEEPYPERLDDLVPKYLPAVPLDPFSDKPFVYERRGEGYLLASVGPNGVYDGGNDMHRWIVGGEWQSTEQGVDYSKSDLVVRMPVPPRPAPVASPSASPPAAAP